MRELQRTCRISGDTGYIQLIILWYAIMTLPKTQCSYHDSLEVTGNQMRQSLDFANENAIVQESLHFFFFSKQWGSTDFHHRRMC